MICILGIETSCDDTAASVVLKEKGQTRGRILSHVISGQVDYHVAFGGVVPEIAARAHVDVLDRIIGLALHESGRDFASLDAIAATAGPGLTGSLIAGLMTGKAIAAAIKKPLFPVNHLEGHALVARLTHETEFPYLLLLVSGGHTQILFVQGLSDYRRFATTLDDALGEAFDKVGRMLGLPFPGGPHVEKSALSGNPDRFRFPRPMSGSMCRDFSFSGLKTAVRDVLDSALPPREQHVADICAGFQAAVADVLCDRVRKAMQNFLDTYPQLNRPSFVVSGGVAANKHIRLVLEELSSCQGFSFVAPPGELCRDNAVMIAWAALERFEAGLFQENALGFAPRSRWPLDSFSEPAFGSGKRGAKA